MKYIHKGLRYYFILSVAIILNIAIPEISVADNIVLRLAHGGSKDHPYQVGAEYFSKLVRDKSEGRVVINVYPDGKLGSEGAAGEGVRLGMIDIAVISAGGMMSHWLPEMQVLDMPYLFRNRNHAYKVLDGEIGDKFNRSMNKYGFENLAYWEIGVRHMTNNVREVLEPNDMNGLKIRVMSANVYRNMIRSLGAVPVPVPFTSVYDAIQRRMIDGEENPITTIRAMKFYKVQKFLSLTGHVYSSAVVIMNLSRFNQLSGSQQDILLDAAKEAAEFQRNYIINKESDDLDYLKSVGMKISTPNLRAFSSTTNRIYDSMSDEIPAALVNRIKAIK